MTQRPRDSLPPIVPQRFLTFPDREEIKDGVGEGFIQVPKSYVSFPANALKVWLWLRERYGAKERYAWESYPNMAAELDISARTVQRMVQWLVQERAVICVQQRKRGAGHTNRLIALTKQPSVDEFNDLTTRLQDAWWKKQDKKSSLSKTKVPKKQDILSAEASQIGRRITPKRKTSIHQQPAKTREAAEAAVEIGLNKAAKAGSDGENAVRSLTTHSLDATPVGFGFSAGGEVPVSPGAEAASTAVPRGISPGAPAREIRAKHGLLSSPKTKGKP